MKTKIFFFILIATVITGCTSGKKPEKPPLAKAVPTEDVYFGMKVSDPYRYMENLKDSTVIDWLKQQSDYSRKILNSIPGRQRLIDKMVEFDQRKTAQVYSLSITDNDFYFYLKSTPDDETGKLFYRNGFGGQEILLFDPEAYGKDTSKSYVISSVSPSPDGSKVAFDLAPNGSESSEILIMDVQTGKLFPETIDRCWLSSASWLPDNESFLYNRLKSSDVHDITRELDSKAFLHRVGTDPAKDTDVLSREKYPQLGITPKDIPVVYYDRDSRYLFGFLATVDNRINAVYAPLAELKKDQIDWKHIIKPEDEIYNFGTTEDDIYLYTPKEAPNFRIIKTSLKNPDLKRATVVIEEDPVSKLSSFTITMDGIYYTLSKNGVEENMYYLPDGSKEAKKLNLPFPAGSVWLSAKGPRYSDIWAVISGWTSDYRRFRYIPTEDTFRAENLSAIAEYPEYTGLTVEEVMVRSHDGVDVPLSLIYKKGIEKNGENPVLIYGYGAYGFSVNPFFSPNFLLWTNEGGILAIAHVRGGSELGDSWYRSGYKTTKPNTWKDLISCAEYLVNEEYTSPRKIAINGGSAGGILIGRAMTERPDLFAAAIPEVGCLNTLRAEESPNGPVNVPEFGTVKDSIECLALYEMDSYQHIRDGEKYPATLVTAGMNDPRVIVWEPAKFAARLQAANTSGKPVLFLADFEAGHGMGNTKTKDFESLADILTFAFWQTGQRGYQLK